MPDLTKDQMIKCFTDGYKKIRMVNWNRTREIWFF